MAEMIDVEVVYGLADRQVLRSLQVPDGTTVIEAIERSGIIKDIPDMAVDEGALGVFSRKVPPDHVLQAGDRVEIYRPLIADPKEVRRQRAETQKSG